MSYFLGNKIPTYNPLWEETFYKDQPDWWQWYHLGHSDGYASFYAENGLKENKNLRQKVESLENLLAANVRVIKQEIINEQKKLQATEEESGKLNSELDQCGSEDTAHQPNDHS